MERLVRSAQPPLVIDLQTHIYDEAYCRPLGTRTEPPANAVSILEPLSAANAGRDRWESGWSLVADRCRTATPWRARAIWRTSSRPASSPPPTAAPPSAGAPLHVFFARESRTQQPGFYVANGETPAPFGADSRMTRIYWHIAEEGAVPLTRAVTTLLNRYQVPFRFKTLSYSGVYTRADAAVLYFAARYYQIVARLLPAIRDEVRNSSPSGHAAAHAEAARRRRAGRRSGHRRELRHEPEPAHRAGDLGRLRARHADRGGADDGAGHPVRADRTVARPAASARRASADIYEAAA